MGERKRLCLRCAGDLRGAGAQCQMVDSAGGSTGECQGCRKRKLCFTWDVTYKTRNEK